jgi:hypothetical protein
LWAAFFDVWHVALGALSRCDISEDVIAKNNSLCDGINTCIAGKTLHVATHVLGDHCDNGAFCAGACCTTRAVKECFVLFWRICVNNNGNVINVDSACSNVCCNKGVYFAIRQCCKVARAYCLRQVAVQFNAGNSRLHKCCSELACAVLGACEDK